MVNRRTRETWWTWADCLGLGLPLAALVWAIVFNELFAVVSTSFWLYQFLLVAVWCVIMGHRLFRVFSAGSRLEKDPALYFAASNLVWISALLMIALICGLWTILFRIGIGIFFYVCLPLLLSMWFVFRPLNRSFGQHGGYYQRLLGCVCFAFGASVPAHYYGAGYPSLDFFLYAPTWILAAFFYLILTAQADKEAPLMEIVILSLICLYQGVSEPMHLSFFYWAILAGCGALYGVFRLMPRMAGEWHIPLGWTPLFVPPFVFYLFTKGV